MRVLAILVTGLAVASSTLTCEKSLNLLQSSKALSTKTHQELRQVGCQSGSNQCIVPRDETWVLDTSLDVGELIVQGKFEWDTSKENLELRACRIMVEDGAEFQVGTAAMPMNNKATIYIKDCPNQFAESVAGQRFLAGRGAARIEIHGRRLEKHFTLLGETAMAGSRELVLKDPAAAMGWRVGDEVGVVTTGGDDESTYAPPVDGSTRHVIEAINGNTITIEPALTAKHLGGMKNMAGSLYEMAAEVVNMERSVKITGDNDGFFTSGQGFHTMIMPEQGKFGVLDVRWARLEYCGQLDKTGRYCLHFHLMKHCPQCVLQGNTVIDSFQSGITIHGTHDSLVDANVLWDNHGVGIYTEDGNEMDNMISNNVVVCSSWDPDRSTAKCRIDWQGGDFRHGGIYLVGKTNSLVGNHIVGWTFSVFTPSGGQTGAGQGEAVGKVCPQFMPIREIRRNVAHNNGGSGIYLDNQYPRNIEVDDDGFVKNMGKCSQEFTYEGYDNGAGMVVEDEFEWYNHAGAVHYSLGDIGFKNLTTIRCGNSVYWKRSKNFADGLLSSKHLQDTIIVDGWMLLPGGPFTFWIQNVKMAGWSHIQAPQHGFAPTMSVQYVLEAMDWLESTAATRLRFGSSGGNPVTMIYLAKDNSMGGYHALVSPYLNGFALVDGCTAAGELWDNGYGCDAKVPVRRLNIWGPDMGTIKLLGPGYEVAAEKPDFWNSEWYDGANAGHMHYDGPDAGEKFTRGGYATPVITGRAYELQLQWSGSDVVFELSDHVVEEYFGAPEVVDLTLITPQGQVKCQVKASASRAFQAKFPPEGLLPEGRWELGDCGEKLREIAGQPPRVAPTTRAPISNLAWIRYPGLNCYGGVGADSAPGNHMGVIDLADCKSYCEEEPECTGIIVTSSDDPVGCFLRKNIVPEDCGSNSPYDLWQLELSSSGPSLTTTASTSSPSPPPTTTLTQSTTPRSTTSTPRPTLTPGEGTWQLHEGLNCYSGNGADIANGDLVSSEMSLDECQAACLEDCEGVVVVRGEDPGRCWLRKSIQPASCNANTAWDMWLWIQPDATDPHDGFEPVSDQDAACRGANSGDNLASYYSVTPTSSLSGCKDLCRSRGSACKGIEFSESGQRCEVWVRPQGIQSSISVIGFACLRYDPSQDTKAGASRHFKPMDGGASRACRGASVSDNSPDNYQLTSAGSFEDCQDLCRALASCKGIEHSSSGRCEIWKRDIQASKAVQGFACYRYDDSESDPVDETIFEFGPVDGGTSRACRGATVTDNSPGYYQVSFASSLDDCQNLCRARPGCKGMEFSSQGRCEVWTRDIEASQAVQGFTCLKLLPKL